MSGPSKQAKEAASGVKASYVTLNKDGKPVWEPGLRAEITSRRQPRVKRKTDEVDETPVTCDLKVALSLSPEARSAWLARALEAIPKGRAKAQEVFEIVTHRKFASGVPEELGQAMLKQVKESLLFFTERQQLGIAKSRLVKDFRAADPGRRGGRRRHDEESSDDHSFDDEAPPRPHHRRHDIGEPRRRDPDFDAVPRPGSSGDAAPEPAPPLPPDAPQASPEELARAARERAQQEAERQRKREQDLRRLEAERRALEERERQRKAKIGSAFLMGGEDDDEEPVVPLGRVPVLDKRRDDFNKQEEPLYGGLKFVASPTSATNTVVAASASSAIQTMGGDSIVNEAQAILVRGAGELLGKKDKEKERKASRSRSRRRRRTPSPSQSRSRERKKEVKGEDRRRRVFESLRSPTPDGHLRGRMRAARKAKMMAQMLQQGNVPRVA